MLYWTSSESFVCCEDCGYEERCKKEARKRGANQSSRSILTCEIRKVSSATARSNQRAAERVTRTSSKKRSKAQAARNNEKKCKKSGKKDPLEWFMMTGDPTLCTNCVSVTLRLNVRAAKERGRSSGAGSTNSRPLDNREPDAILSMDVWHDRWTERCIERKCAPETEQSGWIPHLGPCKIDAVPESEPGTKSRPGSKD